MFSTDMLQLTQNMIERIVTFTLETVFDAILVLLLEIIYSFIVNVIYLLSSVIHIFFVNVIRYNVMGYRLNNNNLY